MRTIELYRKHKAGEVSREKFLYEVRRDKNLPWVTNVTSFDDAVKILKNKGVISEAEISENYEVHYSNQNVKAAKKFNNKQQAINFAQDLVKKGAEEVTVFNAVPNFHSTDDTNAVIKWFGKDGTSMYNKSKNDPKLGAKKMSIGETGVDEAAGDVDTEGTYDITLRNGEVVKNVKFLQNGTNWELETPESYRQGEMSNVKSFEKSKSVNEETDQERDARRKEGDKEMDQTLLTFLKNLNAKSPTDHIAQKIKDQEAEMIKKYGSLNEVDNNIPTDPAVDRVNPYFLKKGVEMLLAKEKELTNDSYIKALNKAASMLEKNPHAFDEEMFANAKDVEKADAKLETEEVKKANHKNKANEMKKVKVKSLKESAIEDLTTHLKKKDLVNEDAHYNHTVGSEVHTPYGKGKVAEITGGTLTVEMEDGKLVDVQINTVDHFTQKAAEEEPSQGAQDEPSVKDMWANWDKNQAKPFSGMVGDPEQFKKPLDLSKLKEYIAKHKDDKEKMGKLKEAIKKLKEVRALVVAKSATGKQIDQLAAADPTIKPGQQIDIIRK